MRKVFKKGDKVRCLCSAPGFTESHTYVVREDYDQNADSYKMLLIETDDNGCHSNGGHHWFFELIVPKEYIVALNSCQGPTPSNKPFAHKSREAAETEARRLAEKNIGSTFAVYERVGAFVADKPTVRSIP